MSWFRDLRIQVSTTQKIGDITYGTSYNLAVKRGLEVYLPAIITLLRIKVVVVVMNVMQNIHRQ